MLILDTWNGPQGNCTCVNSQQVQTHACSFTATWGLSSLHLASGNHEGRCRAPDGGLAAGQEKKKGLGTRRGLRNADWAEEMSTVALWKNWVGERKKLDWAPFDNHSQQFYGNWTRRGYAHQSQWLLGKWSGSSAKGKYGIPRTSLLPILVNSWWYPHPSQRGEGTDSYWTPTKHRAQS